MNFNNGTQNFTYILTRQQYFLTLCQPVISNIYHATQAMNLLTIFMFSNTQTKIQPCFLSVSFSLNQKKVSYLTLNSNILILYFKTSTIYVESTLE